MLEKFIDTANRLLFLQKLNEFKRGEECGLYLVISLTFLAATFLKKAHNFWMDVIYLLLTLHFIEISEISMSSIASLVLFTMLLLSKNYIWRQSPVKSSVSCGT